MTIKQQQILELLDQSYGHNISFLEYQSPFELLIAVTLSAQTTDAQVNKVTPELFSQYPTPEQLAQADTKDVEEIIFTTGFYKAKARNIVATAKILVNEYNSQVPQTMEELLVLKGVGRKTANVILSHCFQKPAIIVDTHFKRVAKRLGFTDELTPEKVELDLLKIIPENMQYAFSMQVNLHGRMLCHARKPQCDVCFLQNLCRYAIAIEQTDESP